MIRVVRTRRKPARRIKYISVKRVAEILKVNPELVAYLRLNDGLPFRKNKKYIVYLEREILRWRNRKLTEGTTTVVMNLLDYYTAIKLSRFCTYEYFKDKVGIKVLLDGDRVIKYLTRQNPERDVRDIVGVIVSDFWDAAKPKCSICGKTMLSKRGVCFRCKP